MGKKEGRGRQEGEGREGRGREGMKMRPQRFIEMTPLVIIICIIVYVLQI